MIDAIAASPLERLRQARITRVAFRRTMCRAASRPRPVFAPVMITVWPANEVSGYGRFLNCDFKKRPRKSVGRLKCPSKLGIIKIFHVNDSSRLVYENEAKDIYIAIFRTHFDVEDQSNIPQAMKP